VSKHLKGLDFPASKQDIMDCAKQNGAEEDVMDTLKGLPDEEYGTMADVMKGYGEEDQGQGGRNDNRDDYNDRNEGRR